VKICELHVQNFRNHTHTDVVFGGGINAVLGENGEGKTNLLEAISYLCLTKSFFGSPDGVVLQVGKERFDVGGELETDSGLRYHVAVSYDQASGEKRFLINKAPVERFSEVVGQFPIVVLSPESGAITSGGPADRRRFLDFVIAQASKVYLEDLLEYRRVLKQRNKLLFDSKVGRTEYGDLIEPWDQELVDRGARITHRRCIFLKELQPIVHESYGQIAGRTEQPTIQYVPSVPHTDGLPEDDLRGLFRQEIKRKAPEEKRLGITLVGPHRDELELSINTLSVRSHASQGQHKTFLIALKIAEFLYLQAKRSERPMLLLDDIFTELDRHRSERLLALTESVGQAFITTTSGRVFPPDFNWMGANQRFLVSKGTVDHAKAASLAN
jgi:DNA replication and repair protein RecF